MSDIDVGGIFEHAADTYLYLAKKGGFENGDVGNKYVISKLPSPTYNFLYIKEKADSLLDYALTQNVSFICIARKVDGFAEAAAKYDLAIVENLTSHLLTTLPDDYAPNNLIEIRQVTSKEELAEFDNISSICFHDTPGYAIEFMQRSLGSEKFMMYIACVDGNPAGIGALSTVSELAGLYWLGVLPEFRNKGIATEIVKKIVNVAKNKGFEEVLSQNMNASKSLFRRLGFKPMADLPLYCYIAK